VRPQVHPNNPQGTPHPVQSGNISSSFQTPEGQRTTQADARLTVSGDLFTPDGYAIPPVDTPHTVGSVSQVIIPCFMTLFIHG
jgi:hypothetical protein